MALRSTLLRGHGLKAIIHIGMAKTGSSSIQTWLRSNQVALKAERVYSNMGIFGDVQRHGLKHAVYLTALQEFCANERTAWLGPRHKIPGTKQISIKIVNLLADQLKKLPTESSGIFIYSYERLYGCNEIQIMALDKYLSRFFRDVSYVVYIRDVVDFFVSMYSQKIINNQVNEHATQEYFDFMNKCANVLVPYGPESSFENLFNWDNVLGDKLSVRLLEPDWLVNGDLIDDFASLAGVATLDKPPRMNESIAAEYIEYVRFLNREFRDDLPLNIRRKFVEILKQASFGKPKLVASDAQAKSIRDIHREEEERIKNVLFPGRPFLFSPKSYGCGIEPVPLTVHRKAEIELEIREKMAPEYWEAQEIFLRPPTRLT